MREILLVLLIGVAGLAGCTKSTTSAQSAARSGDAVQQKLQEVAGHGAVDCGRLRSQEASQVKTAADCAMQAAQSKRAFYVAYDLPGVTVAVAGNGEGKLFTVQAQTPENGAAGTTAEVHSAPCPAELRVAQSGRVTCMTPGAGMGMTGTNPHGSMMTPPAGTENPHGGAAVPAHPGSNQPPAGSKSPKKPQ